MKRRIDREFENVAKIKICSNNIQSQDFLFFAEKHLYSKSRFRKTEKEFD